MRLVTRAADFAARRHAQQRRKGESAEPYVNHLLEVAGLLADATGGTDPQLVAAGLLHDVIEDTPTAADEIGAAFGEPVAAIVVELTDDKSLPKAERKRLQIAGAPSTSAAAKLVRIADKISNVRSLISSPPADWSVERQRDYVTFAEAVVDGCRGVNAGLDAAFDEVAAAARAAIDGVAAG